MGVSLNTKLRSYAGMTRIRFKGSATSHLSIFNTGRSHPSDGVIYARAAPLGQGGVTEAIAATFGEVAISRLFHLKVDPKDWRKANFRLPSA